MDLSDIVANKDKIRSMPPQERDVFLDMAYDRFVKGSKDAPDRTTWTNAILGIKPPPKPESFGSKMTRSLQQGVLETTSNMERLVGQKGRAQEQEEASKKLFGAPVPGATGVIGRNIPPLMMSAALGSAAGAMAPEAAIASPALSAAAKVATTAGEAVPFSRSPAGLAGNTAAFGLTGELLGATGRKLKGLLQRAPASEAPTPLTPSPESAPSVLKIGAPSTAGGVEAGKNAVLDRLGVPPGDLRTREAWLMDIKNAGPEKVMEYQNAVDKIDANEAKARKVVRDAMKGAPSVVKNASKNLSRDEKVRLVTEAKKLRDLKTQSGQPETKVTKEEVESIKGGKTAEEVFNPATAPAVVAEQPQVAKVVPQGEESKQPVNTSTIERAIQSSKPRYGYGQNLYQLDFESQTDKALYTIAQAKKNKMHDVFLDYLKQKLPGMSDAQIIEKGKDVRARIKSLAAGAPSGTDTLRIPASPVEVGPKVKEPKAETKIPELGDKLLMARYSAALKSMKLEDVIKMIDSDAKELGKKIMASTDTENEKFAKLHHVDSRLRALKAKLSSGEVGKTSGLSKVGKQTAQREPTVGEELFNKIKGDEQRAANAPQASMKDRHNAFVELWGREPLKSEAARLDTGMSPGEAVDQEYQLKFENELEKKGQALEDRASKEGL